MNKKHLFLSFLLVLVASFSYAQTQPQGKVLTLQEALRFAVANNENVKKALQDEQSAEYKIKETQGSGLPQLSANGRFTMNPSLPVQLLPGEIAGQPGTLVPVRFGTKYAAQGGLEVQQLIFRKSFFVGLEAANTTRDLYALRTRMSEEDVLYNVGSSYLQLLQTKEQFKNIEANLNRLDQLEKILDLQYRNDVATKVEYNRVTVNKINLENQRQTLAATYEQQLNGLKFFMGLPMDEPIEIPEATANLLNVLVPPVEDAKAILAQRVDYQTLLTQKRLNELNVKNIQAGYFPTLSGFGQLNYNAQRNQFNFFDGSQPWFQAAAVGLQLNIPIFDGFQRRNQIRQAQNEVRIVDYDISLAARNTQMALNNSIRQMEASLASIQAQERNVELAQEVYRNTNELYKEGLAPLTDVLSTEVSLREARTNLNNEQLKYQIAQLDYIRARGEIKNLLN
ncbi:TolC family protein [Rufibacter roseus]|uniref:TolC family protein n=1 Tax=Rufibacter roseus TaxID=1567108 RepID=A0ABW2DMA8_9BACT|nr:TolC family protein [Rufibacter roseus]